MQKFIKYSSIALLIAVSVLITRVVAADQLKTTETFVGSSASQISSGQTDLPFSLYIGDTISGVATSVKSVHIAITGVYTGNGSLQIKLDNDGATAQTFALPSVSAPTPFEILYNDTTKTIDPATAGTYTHTLNVTPSGVTVSGLGAKAAMTYRYVPGSCDDGQPSNEKLKTTETFVGSSASQISSGQTDLPFSLYIGDTISGVATSVKSVHIAITGVYTGNGSLQIKLDNDGATAQTFALPSVSAPTPFEILYNDTTKTIDPATAGTYTHTLNVTPSGVTVSGLGAKAIMTYRYKPPACGGGYPPTGDVSSAVFDTTVGGAYNSILWKGMLGGPAQNQGKVRFQFATSDNSSGPWSFIGGSTCASGDWYDPGAQNVPIELTCAAQYHNNQRYYRYKVQLCSDDCLTGGTYTPTVQDVVVNWAP